MPTAIINTNEVHKDCGRCIYNRIKKQVKGVARLYVRPKDPGDMRVINGKWVIYVVPKGSKLKQMMDRHNWSIEVLGHPLRAHIIKTAKELKNE